MSDFWIAAETIRERDAEITRLREQLAHEVEAHAETQAALRAMMDDLDKARADVMFAAGIEAAAGEATSFLVGDPKNDIPLRNPMAHEIAKAIRALTPPGATAAAARVLLDDLALALSTEIGVAGGKEAGRRWSAAHDAAESAPTAMNSPTPIQMIRAAMRAIADGGDND